MHACMRVFAKVNDQATAEICCILNIDVMTINGCLCACICVHIHECLIFHKIVIQSCTYDMFKEKQGHF